MVLNIYEILKLKTFFGKRAVVHLASTQLHVLMGSIPKTTYVYVPKDILEPIVTE